MLSYSSYVQLTKGKTGTARKLKRLEGCVTIVEVVMQQCIL
jgi:hypothetical protein